MPWALNPTVEYYGLPCVSPSNHPQDPKEHYPLIMTQGLGCEKKYFGVDETYSHYADSQDEFGYYIYNYGSNTIENEGWDLAENQFESL